MAISPQDLMKRVSDKNRNVLDDLEQKVNESLERSFNGRSATITPSREFDALPQYMKEQFLDQYRQVGWEVKQHSDQREGEFLVFQYKQGDLAGGYFNK